MYYLESKPPLSLKCFKKLGHNFHSNVLKIASKTHRISLWSTLAVKSFFHYFD